MEIQEKNGPCFGRLEQDKQLFFHQITAEQYKSYVAAYYHSIGKQPDKPKMYDAKVIKRQINEPLTCRSYVQVFIQGEVYRNLNIQFQVATPEPTEFDDTRFYPLSLFLGFFARPLFKVMTGPPEQFWFSLARSPKATRDTDNFVFYIVDANKHITYWDLSAGVPPAVG